jgi:hypothetical protein
MNQPQPAPAGVNEWKCIDFRRHEKKTLQGFARLRHEPTGIVINDCPVHQKDSKRWISLPARPYQTEKDGPTKWIPLVEIPDRDQQRNFQDDALAALNAYLRSPEYRGRRTEADRR